VHEIRDGTTHKGCTWGVAAQEFIALGTIIKGINDWSCTQKNFAANKK